MEGVFCVFPCAVAFFGKWQGLVASGTYGASLGCGRRAWRPYAVGSLWFKNEGVGNVFHAVLCEHTNPGNQKAHFKGSKICAIRKIYVGE